MNMKQPSTRQLLRSGAALLLLAACSSGSGTSGWTFIPPQPTGSPGPSGAASEVPCPSGGAAGSPAASTSTAPGSPAASAASAPSPAASASGATASPPASASAYSSPVSSPAPAAAGTASASSVPGAAESAEPSGSAPAASAAPVASAAPAGSAPAASAAPGTSAAPAESAAAGNCGATGTVIALEETSSLSITKDGQPATAIDVKKGDTVIFKITNSAGFAHDFYIGTPDQLSTNQTSCLTGIPSFESGKQQFTYTVTDDTANLQFACTLPGHYQLMHGTFNVTP
jgi:uncharacterized cupredoxin-like copper-binding protein